MSFPVIITAAAALLIGAGPAWAAQGIVLTQQVTSGGTTSTSTVQIAGNRMRAEMTDPTGTRQTVIFDAATQTLFIVNDSQKAYSELTKADVDRLAAQMQQMMAQMKEQMAGLPPAARAQMEAMLSGSGLMMPAPTEYRRAGAGKVGAWACDRYEGFQNGQKTSEVCTAAPDALGLTASDFAVVEQMAEFLRAIVPGEVERLFAVGRADQQGFSGIPVRQVSSAGGQDSTMEMTAIRRQEIDDAVLQVPAGYQRQEFAPGIAGTGAGPGR